MKKMIDFPNYAVTKDGQIWSYKTHKFLSLGREEKNSLHVTLFQNGVRHLRKVHRLVAEGYLPNPESKENVYHINGMRDDNRVENLAWGTPSESSKNAWNTGACSVEKFVLRQISPLLKKQLSSQLSAWRLAKNIPRRQMHPDIYD